MKLTGAAAVRYFGKPEAGRAGLLIFGTDAMRVALRRQEVIAALIGPQGEEEMRLNRIAGADLRKDTSLLLDAIRAVGFFPGPRVVLVEDAGDALAEPVTAALKGWQTGDALIIVTAGSLTTKSRLRKAFEGHDNAYSIGVHDDPPSREEVDGILRKAGLNQIDADAMTALIALSRALDPGDFCQTVEKIALYKFGDTTPLTLADVTACAPSSVEAGVDDVLAIVAEGRASELGPVMQRLDSQGVQPVQLAIAALRHFRALHAAASDPKGPGAGIARIRPPVFGPRRDRMLRQAQGWGMMKLESALRDLVETDLSLRSISRAPQMAVMERALMRLAMMARR